MSMLDININLCKCAADWSRWFQLICSFSWIVICVKHPNLKLVLCSNNVGWHLMYPFVMNVSFIMYHLYLYCCSIQEDLLHLAPLHHLHTLPVVMKKKEDQGGPSPGLRGQRRKRSPSQEARILEQIVKIMAQFVFQDSLGTSRVNSVWILGHVS